jgi:hypothetical protein
MPAHRPTDEYQQPPDDTFPHQQAPIIVPAEVVASTLQTLNLLDEYFRLHAGTAARADLRTFAGRQGWEPTQGAQVLIESIGLHALALTRARDTQAG